MLKTFHRGLHHQCSPLQRLLVRRRLLRRLDRLATPRFYWELLRRSPPWGMCLSATSTPTVRPSRNKGREQLKRNRRPEKLTFLSQNLRSFRKDEKREELLFALREQERKWFAVCLQEVGQKEMREIECDDATMWLAKGRPNKNGKGGDSIGLGMVLCRDAMQAWKDGGGRRT